jgi:hypothetical protein
MSIKAIQEYNKGVWESYKLTKDKSVLSNLQRIPTGGYSEKIHQASVKW